MAHAVYTRDLGRNRSWRKATVRSLAQALLRRERIKTTQAKAKEAQRLTERLITLGKKGTLSARRQAASLLGDPDLVRRLFSEVAPRFQNRSGGYTRILHDGFRTGDGAEMAFIELVERAPEEKPKPRAEVKPQPPPPGVPLRKEAPVEGRPKLAEKKHRGFLDGLRRFFKRRDNP